jgi:hypothetical protein
MIFLSVRKCALAHFLIISAILLSSCAFHRDMPFPKNISADYRVHGISIDTFFTIKMLGSYSYLRGKVVSSNDDFRKLSVPPSNQNSISFFAKKGYFEKTLHWLNTESTLKRGSSRLMLIETIITELRQDFFGDISQPIEIVLVPDDYSYMMSSWNRISKNSAIMRFAFHFNRTDEKKTIAEIVRTITHETIHAQFKLRRRTAKNSLSEEIIALLGGVCADTHLNGKIPYPSFSILPNADIMRKVDNASVEKILSIFKNHSQSVVANVLAQKHINIILAKTHLSPEQQNNELFLLCRSSWNKNIDFKIANKF